MNAAHGFRSVVAVHTDGQPWRDLVDYATMLAGSAGQLDAVIAAPGGHLEAALEAAREHRADLLVMRHPRVSGQSRRSAQRILRAAPCSVCFLPPEAPAKADRILAGIDLNGAGRALLARATQLCRGVSAEELIAVHCCFRESADDDESTRERFRFERMLRLFRFMSHAELNGVACTPVLEEGATAHKALARVVSERSADLVVMGREPGGRASIMGEFLWNCASPTLQVLLPHPPGTSLAGRLARNVRKILSHPEPTFN